MLIRVREIINLYKAGWVDKEGLNNLLRKEFKRENRIYRDKQD